MAGDDNSTFFLNLDASDFLSGVGDAKSAISNLSDADSLKGLIQGFETVGIAAGVLGAAVLAIKESMDLVFEAENIKQVNAQFDALSENAGVLSEKLKAGLIDASKGWVDETSLMKAANKAMTELEVGADRLPEVMTIARQATAVFGGDITQNFETISNAVAAGNTRMLRHLGIIVDQQKAYREYASSIGSTVGALSKAGQQQAVLNAVLSQGKEKFGSVNEDIKQNLNAWSELKAAIKEIGETFALAFDSIAGPRMATFFHMLKNNLESAKTWIKASFGQGAEQADASVKLLNDRITETKKKIEDIQNKKGIGAAMTTGEAQIQTQLLTAQLQKYEQELGKASKADEKFVQDRKEREKDAQGGGIKTSGVDPIKQAEQESKAKKDLAALDSQITQQKIQSMDSISEATELYNKQLQEQGKEVDAQIAQVRAQAQAGTITQKQATDEIAKLNELKDLKMAKDDQALAKMQQQALDHYVANSKNTFDGVGRAFHSMSEKNKMALKDFGANGDKVAQSFGSHMTSAFQEIGSGAKSGTDAMKDAFFGMIADVAAQYGQMMMLASIFPFNPPVFAAGAALEMLSGMLGSAGGGGSTSSFTAGSQGTGISGDPGSLNSPANPTGGTSLASNTNGPRSVNLIVQGNVFNNDQTSRWIVDQVRAASDATDFKISSIGGGL